MYNFINTLDYSKLYHSSQSENPQEDFLVVSCFTKNYEHYAKEFLHSILDKRLPCVIYEIPEIHHSVSISGTEDMRFSKHNFIISCLRYFKSNILFLDIDLILIDYPDIFLNSRFDFMIYNWLSDIHNTGYRIEEDSIDNISKSNHIHKEYKPVINIPYYDPNQLLCSGPVQYYKPKPEIFRFLSTLGEYLSLNPLASDDHLMDVFFNFNKFNISYGWLPKEYCRFPWWPHIKPTILHNNWPTPEQNRPSNVLKMFDENRCLKKTSSLPYISNQKLYIYN